MKLADLIAALAAHVSREGFALIYLATDSRREELIDALRAQLPLKTADDFVALREISDDNYRLSLVEQELARRAGGFIGTELSTWSEMILHVILSFSSPFLNIEFDLEWMIGSNRSLDQHLHLQSLMSRFQKPYEQHDVWQHVIGSFLLILHPLHLYFFKKFNWLLIRKSPGAFAQSMDLVASVFIFISC